MKATSAVSLISAVLHLYFYFIISGPVWYDVILSIVADVMGCTSGMM